MLEMVRSACILDVARRDAAFGDLLNGARPSKAAKSAAETHLAPVGAPQLGGAGSAGRAAFLSLVESSVQQRVGSAGHPQPGILQSGPCGHRVVGTLGFGLGLMCRVCVGGGGCGLAWMVKVRTLGL